MDKKIYLECLEKEIYQPYKSAKGKLSWLDKLWCKYISPESNAVFLVRKKLYWESKNGGGRLLSRLYHVRLMRRYGIHITEGTEIGIGLRIAHPSSIIVTKCKIGKNFTIYQNCTIGQKFYGSGQFPVIGDNVTMYAGSNVIGKIKIGDGAVIGAGATVVDDVPDNAIMVGEKGRVKV